MADVAKLQGVGPVLQSRLAEAGITTIQDVALAEPSDLLKVPGIGRRRGSMLIVQARAALGDELPPLLAVAEAKPTTARDKSERTAKTSKSKGSKKKRKKKKKGKKGRKKKNRKKS